MQAFHLLVTLAMLSPLDISLKLGSSKVQSLRGVDDVAARSARDVTLARAEVIIHPHCYGSTGLRDCQIILARYTKIMLPHHLSPS